jgi:hypothetical protein
LSTNGSMKKGHPILWLFLSGVSIFKKSSTKIRIYGRRMMRAFHFFLNLNARPMVHCKKMSKYKQRRWGFKFYLASVPRTSYSLYCDLSRHLYSVRANTSLLMGNKRYHHFRIWCKIHRNVQNRWWQTTNVFLFFCCFSLEHTHNSMSFLEGEWYLNFNFVQSRDLMKCSFSLRKQRFVLFDFLSEKNNT